MQITNQIHFRNLRGDIFGGMTAAIIALPMALAFGVASGAGPAAGLYGAVLVGFFAALFGGTPTLISEPTGPMTVVMTSVIAQMIASQGGDRTAGLALAFTVVVMAGIVQILLGVLKLGRYVTLMPYTVVSGFMSGIGIILIILQTAPFLGQKSPGGGVLGTVQNIPNLIANIQPIETILAVLTIAILVFSPKQINKYIPPQLSALAIGTVVSLVFFGNVESIRRIGEIKAGLPQFVTPTFDAGLFQTMLIDALVLGMLGCIDALLTSVVADSLTRTEHDSNKELIGQGIGNIASGLFGGIAGAGATMGTVVNIQTGARTALSGLTRALILLVIVLWAAPLTSVIPLAVLAAIALKVGINIIDWSFLKRAHKVSPKAALIMYGVIILTVFVDLIVAVGIGVFVANILTIERLTNLRSEEVKTITDADDAIILNDVEKDLLDRANNRVLLFHLEGPMIFGVSKAIAREQTAMKDHDVLILDLTDVPHIGVTSSLAVENMIKDALDKGRHVFIVGAKGKIKQRLQKLGIFNLLPPHHVVMEREEALKQALSLVSYRSDDMTVDYPTTGYNETALG
ncbi:SulP family inorganic anion transporter [Plectonema cf. radiosum LEGE 06105]|uniref:SulP family inorganic anion transporter n=1 Tax=Plectonema cf. radiosum LEGE 06105 TaxID=945769 RepID=A0A8J7FLX7_9CYAN|nr:SulP family inorganic anion transporter [Plectonema radiosum]MBE9215876.1 SulP family inorganic anion transporter [Plectonema cf. radiosum LEGE 06105]